MAPHVVVIGGGFAGLQAAKGLGRAPVRITLIDRRNHHLFQPLLYQVASAALAPGDIAEPIRSVLAKQRNVQVRLGEVTRVDLEEKAVYLGEEQVAYDHLVIAAGATHSYFGHPEWEDFAPGLKTVGDALQIRRRVLGAFERAEWESDPAKQRQLLTFVVVGGGPTGVELAGSISEIAFRTLVREYRNIDTSMARVVLIEASERVLGNMGGALPEHALAQLRDLGVEVRLGDPVSLVDSEGVELAGERIEAATVIWAAGVQGEAVASSLGVELDRAGRIRVQPDLSVAGWPGVWAIGDIAHTPGPDGKPLPGLAPVAIKQGAHVAANIRRVLAGDSTQPFAYRDLGTMATIGRSRAVADVMGWRSRGFVAWLLWVFIHLMTLVGHRNRLVVFVKWSWAWFTWQRSSRLMWQDEHSR